MGYIKKLGRYFLAGVFTLLPLIITAAVAIWLTGFISQYLGPGTALGGLVKSF